MHGCSRDCIYNHSLDCRDLAATTVRAHLIINIKYLIGENDCLNTTEKLLLQLNERNNLTWVLNKKRLIGIPLLERRVGLSGICRPRIGGSITINLLLSQIVDYIYGYFQSKNSNKLSALLWYQRCWQHICLCASWYTYKVEQMDVIHIEMYILRVGSSVLA